MIETVFLVFLATAIIMTILSVKDISAKDLKSFVWPSLAMMSWLICSVGVISIERPYSFLYENTADNSVKVIEGVQALDSAAPLSILFLGLTIICILLLFNHAFGIFEESI